MTEQLLITVIAGHRVALQTSTLHSMVAIDAVTPVPRTHDHIAGLSALRSRVLTVIDCRRSLGMAPDEAGYAKREAIVVESSGHFYALVVDGVEDVVEAQSAPQPTNVDIGHGWRDVSLGLVETSAGALLLVDAAKIIAGREDAQVDA